MRFFPHQMDTISFGGKVLPPHNKWWDPPLKGFARCWCSADSKSCYFFSGGKSVVHLVCFPGGVLKYYYKNVKSIVRQRCISHLLDLGYSLEIWVYNTFDTGLMWLSNVYNCMWVRTDKIRLHQPVLLLTNILRFKKKPHFPTANFILR